MPAVATRHARVHSCLASLHTTRRAFPRIWSRPRCQANALPDELAHPAGGRYPRCEGTRQPQIRCTPLSALPCVCRHHAVRLTISHTTDGLPTMPAVAPAIRRYTLAWRSPQTTRRAFLAFGRHHAVKLTISRPTGRARPPCRRWLPRRSGTPARGVPCTPLVGRSLRLVATTLSS